MSRSSKSASLDAIPGATVHSDASHPPKSPHGSEGGSDASDKGADDERRLSRAVFDNTSEGIIITDPQGRIMQVNTAFEAITGYVAHEVIGNNPSMLKSGAQDDDFYQAMWQSLLKHGQWRGEIWNRRKSGEAYPEWLTISAVRNEAGRCIHYVGVFSDVSSVREAQDRLAFLARHDALTRLPNRTLLGERIEHALKRAQRHNAQIAILFLDLDRFKNVNDTLGHSVGDALLQDAAARMSAILRGDDTLARLGGDEFVLLIEDDVSSEQAEVVADKILSALSQPFDIGGRSLNVSASVGISLYPRDGCDVDTLLMNADRAMYQAKSRGRNRYQLFSAELAEGAYERLMMESSLSGAVARNELVLHYQPQVDLTDGRLVAIEALVRWRRDDGQLVSPVRFIPVAEEIGIIDEIGEWVLREACSQLALWRAEGLDIGRIAVNLSARQITTLLPGIVASVLASSGLSGEQLELELTESMIMSHAEEAQRVLMGLRALGVKVAIDDFGTGYSSLAYLKRLPIDRLKIDKSFVQDIGRDASDDAITRAIIAMARALELETVAEGVEMIDQVDFLRREGCTMAQGYHFARPVSATELRALLSRGGTTLPV